MINLIVCVNRCVTILFTSLEISNKIWIGQCHKLFRITFEEQGEPRSLMSYTISRHVESAFSESSCTSVRGYLII